MRFDSTKKYGKNMPSNKRKTIFYELFPANRKSLLNKLNGNSIIEQMSESEFNNMIVDCLTGENPRLMTEAWAQSKVFHGVFTGIQEMFENGKKNDSNFILQAPNRAAEYLFSHHNASKNSEKISLADKTLCQWICNLTNKGWDNILQANPDNLGVWADTLVKSIKSVDFGSTENNIVNMVIYNASLAKKGGLKSAMGYLFEPILLYSAFLACGLTFLSLEDFLNIKQPCSFTLDVNDGRQADAQVFTGLADPQKLFIDIGFIGKGNPEIIADKTQRFSHQMRSRNAKPLTDTIIIVSAIPAGDNAQLVARQATQLGAKVITMSGNNWIYDLSLELNNLGIKGLNTIDSDIDKARAQLIKNPVLNGKHILEVIPNNTLSVPKSW